MNKFLIHIHGRQTNRYAALCADLSQSTEPPSRHNFPLFAKQIASYDREKTNGIHQSMILSAMGQCDQSDIYLAIKPNRQSLVWKRIVKNGLD
ncbi:hypothetical protein ACFSHR_15420 [Azotobacter chroococcum]